MKNSVIINKYKELEEIKNQISELEKKKRELEKFLQTKIPPETSIDNVFHHLVVSRNIPYKIILEEVEQTIVPKTKRPEIENIILKYTKNPSYSTFKLQEA